MSIMPKLKVAVLDGLIKLFLSLKDIWFWICMYFGLIVFFAFIYLTFLPNELYHSTALYEHSLNEKSTKIENKLEEKVESLVNTYYASSDPVISFDIEVDGLRSGLDYTTFSFIVTELGQLNSHSSRSDSIFEVSIPNDTPDDDSSLSIGSSSELMRESTLPTKIIGINPAGVKKLEYFSKPFKLDDTPDHSNTYITLPLEIFESVTDFARISNGFPYPKDDHDSRYTTELWFCLDAWKRMLYFSAVTITTKGYGDIVPLTGKSRLVVAVESILGLLIMGLFINSVAKKV